MSVKITVVGAGHVGATTAQRVAELGIANEVALIDILEGVPKGKALDLWETAPVVGYDTRLEGGTDYALADGSDVVIVTAGLPRKPGMSRDDLLKKNTEIVQGVAGEIATRCPDAIVLVVSNPLDVMCYVALKTTGFDRKRVIGMAGVLDTARFRSFIALELGIDHHQAFERCRRRQNENGRRRQPEGDLEYADRRMAETVQRRNRRVLQEVGEAARLRAGAEHELPPHVELGRRLSASLRLCAHVAAGRHQ